MGKSALIIVDVQYDFLPPDGSLGVPGGQQVIPVIQELLEPAYNWDIVLASQDYHPPDHISFASTHGGEQYANQKLVNARGEQYEQVLWPDHCVVGSRGVELADEIQKKLDSLPEGKVKLVRKGWHNGIEAYSAFEGYITDAQSPSDPPTSLSPAVPPRETDLAVFLKQRGIDKVVVTGLATDYCVLSTAESSIQAGFDTLVLDPAVRGISEAGSERALEKIQEQGGKILGQKDKQWAEDLHSWIGVGP